MRTFTMPAEADPEPGAPDLIQHGCDYMANPDGSLEFYYNFLEYVWRLNGIRIAARCYLDESDTINFGVPQTVLDAPDASHVLAFVQRRFRQIATFESVRYEARWSRGAVTIRNG